VKENMNVNEVMWEVIWRLVESRLGKELWNEIKGNGSFQFLKMVYGIRQCRDMSFALWSLDIHDEHLLPSRLRFGLPKEIRWYIAECGCRSMKPY